MTNADFWLASKEWKELDEPRRCFVVRRLRASRRDDLMLVRIDPPLLGQPLGLGDMDVDEVILATRHRGESLFSIKRWPVFVHLARVPGNLGQRDTIDDGEIRSLARAEIYPTEQAAKLKMYEAE